MEKTNMESFEKAQDKELKQERPQYKVELKERPEPLTGESLDAWLKRIGGPNIKISESLEKCSDCKGLKLSKKHSCEPTEAQQENTPLVIDKSGNFILNDKNLGTYFDKDKIEDLWASQNPNIKFIKKRGEYQIKKELFKSPELYRKIIIEELGADRKMVADKRFNKSIMKWEKEIKEAPEEEKTGKESETEKPLTLDEKIAQKKKELEEAQMGYNIYYSPVVKDLLGLYYEDRLKTLKKEMKGLEKSRGKKTEAAKEVQEQESEEPEIKLKDYLKHIKNTDDLFTEMTKIRGAVKRGEAGDSDYEDAKGQWRKAYQKTLEMNDMLTEKDVNKLMRMDRKRKNKKGRSIKKKWKEFWNLITKKVGKKTVEETTKDAIEEQLKVAREKIQRGGVIGRSQLEKEERRLEKLLKKY